MAVAEIVDVPILASLPLEVQKEKPMDLYQLLEESKQFPRTEQTDRYLQALLNENPAFAGQAAHWPHAIEMVQKFPGVINIWKTGRLLDPSWVNVVGHQIGVAEVAQSLAELYGLSQQEVDEVILYALVHDGDKREEKEYHAAGGGETNGKLQYLNINLDKYAHDEGMKKGLFEATGDNANNFQSWGPKEWILRCADCLVGPVGPEKTDDVVSMDQRVAEWKKRDMGKQPQLAAWLTELETKIYPAVAARLSERINSPINRQWIKDSILPRDLSIVLRRYIGLDK